MTGWIVTTVVAFVVLSWGVGAYKRLVSLQNHARKAFSQLDAQLKRRYELIPHLVEAAKGCSMDARDTLEAAIDARNQASAANSKAAADPSDRDAMRRMASAEEMLSATLSRTLALAASCPDDKAGESLRELADELSSTGNRIAFARQAYNEGAEQYNTSRAQFPSSIIAVVFAFKPAEPLHAVAAPVERRQDRVAH